MDREAPRRTNAERHSANGGPHLNGAEPGGAQTQPSANLADTDPEGIDPTDADIADTDPTGERLVAAGTEAPEPLGRWDWRAAMRAGRANDVAREERRRPKPAWPPARRRESARPPRRARKSRGPMVVGGAITSRPLLNPRLRADPRLRVWTTRAAVTLGVYLIAMFWLSVRISLTIAVAYLTADILLRRRTMEIIPAFARVTYAQRSTSRRLRLLRPAGYLALNACTIPGTDSIIDHVVIGPAGIFVLDSQKLDRRLTIHAIDGVLYHGPASQVERLEHSRWEARQAAQRIGAELGNRVAVHAAMVIYGPSVPWIVMRLMGVDVIGGNRIGTYFRRRSRAAAHSHLTSSQIAMVFSAASRALPPVR